MLNKKVALLILVLFVMTVSNPITQVNAGSSIFAAESAVNTPTKWRNVARSALWYEEPNTQYASDHVLLKRIGQPVERVPVASGSNVSETVSYWQQQDNIEYVEPDGLYRVLGQQTSWGWSTVKASEAATTNGMTGNGIVVAVVDTGVDYVHEDLDDVNWVNTGETANNSTDDDANGHVDDYYGWDFIGSLYTAVTPDNDPQDEYGHGTHVAGIIAAENNSVGVRGVAPLAQIMPVKVLDSSGYGFDSTIADGIRYAVDEGADIINLSLGSSAGSNTLKSAIDYAETNNVLVIAASGNESTFSAPSYPAVYSNVVSVGATNEDGYKAEFSNWGKVDVMAPGVDILSSIPGNLYEQYSGTSMAAPHVAGVAALIMQKLGGPTTSARRVRHVLETTTTDFGVMSGPDYMSGYGMVNALAATSTLSNSVFAFSDSSYIISDASSDAVISVSVHDSNASPIVGETVSWSTTKGTLSAASSTTNSNGIATVTLTADDTAGLATVTADPTNYNATTTQIAILNDIPKVESVGVSPYINSSDSDTDDEIIIEEVEAGVKKNAKDDANTDSDESSTVTGELSYNYYQPGDQIIIWGYPTAFDRETHDVVMNFSVTDPDGNAVSELAGTTAETSVGTVIWYWYLPQVSMQSLPLTIPSTAATGQYTVTVTLTEQDTNETSTSTTSFWVGELPDVLVLDNDGYCYDTPVEGLDFGYVAYCDSAGQKVVDALADAGYDNLLWNITMHGTPLAEDLLLFPLVVVVDATYAYSDTTTLQSYLDAGGNLLVTSEQFAYYNTSSGQPSDFLWNYLHAAYAASITQPDVVTGSSGTDFAGQTYNVNTYDLNGNGTHAMYVSDELQLNDDDGYAEAIFAHSQGETTNKIAGIRTDTGEYRAALLSFGVEAVNDVGTATKANLLTELAAWLLGDAPTISQVSPSQLENNTGRTITITGDNFQMTGTTTVKLRKRQLSDVVVKSRTKITALVPAGLDPRQYSVTVTRPDGQEIKKGTAVKIVKGGPTIDSVSPNFVSNDRTREIVISGNKFTASSRVYFGKTRMTKVSYDGSTQLTVKVTKDFAIGHYALKVRNSATQRAKRKNAVVVRVGFSSTLGNGSVDSQVLALERRLKGYGYFTGTPNNAFDDTTEEALARYQHDQGIAASGLTDALTRYFLNTNE